MDPVRRLTLALLLASVAALGASIDDAPHVDREVVPPQRSPSVVPLRLDAAMVYDERRCRERALNPYWRRLR